MLAALVAVVSVLASPVQPPVQPADGVVSGVVREQGTGAPIGGAQVMMVREWSGPPPSGMPGERTPQATTDASGRFDFRGVAPGRYRFHAQRTGFAISMGPDAFPAAVEVSGNVDTVEIVLTRGGVLVGRVLDASGEPVANAMVSAMRDIPRSPARAAGAPPFALPRLMAAGPGSQTDDLGEFRLHSLAAGEYVVRVMARPFEHSSVAPDGRATTLVPTYAPGTIDPDAADRVTVQSGVTTTVGDIRVVSAPAFRISGTVVDAAGRPVVGALIRLTPSDPTADMRPMSGPAGQGRTDARGAFALDGVVAGAYTLIAVAPVVIATAPAGAGGGVSVSGLSGGPGGTVTTESRNGTTIQFRDDAGTRMPVTVTDDAVTGLQIVVRR